MSLKAFALKQALEAGATFEEYCNYVVLELDGTDSDCISRGMYSIRLYIVNRWGWGKL